MTSLNKCHICQKYGDHSTPKCPKLVCAKCRQNGHAKIDCPDLKTTKAAGSEPEVIDLTTGVTEKSNTSGQMSNVDSNLSVCDLECVEENVLFRNLTLQKGTKTYVFIKVRICSRNIRHFTRVISIIKTESFPTEVSLLTNEIRINTSNETFDIIVRINENCKSLCSFGVIKQLRVQL